MHTHRFARKYSLFSYLVKSASESAAGTVGAWCHRSPAPKYTVEEGGSSETTLLGDALYAAFGGEQELTRVFDATTLQERDRANSSQPMKELPKLHFAQKNGSCHIL
jgi:hypothetical protein